MTFRCVCLAALLGLGLGLASCSDEPATGPTIHCFNQTAQLDASVATGKTTVNCPVEAP